MTTTTNVTVTINNQTVTADLATIAALLNMATETAMSEQPKQAKSDKPAKKAHEIRSKHDAILDSKRVERMVKTATDKLARKGFMCKVSKQGKWIWVYPTNGQGRTPEFKSVALPKGWKHSMKRGAYFRDFS